jgi:hypothetical protein
MNFRAHASAMNPQHHADLRFALGAVLAVAVLVAFVVSLHLFGS